MFLQTSNPQMTNLLRIAKRNKKRVGGDITFYLATAATLKLKACIMVYTGHLYVREKWG